MAAFIYPEDQNGGRGTVGIYIHIPFCLSKCHYCDFCSVLRCDEEKREQYVQRVCREISYFSEKIGENGKIPHADTVYFGGGTPTMLSSEQFSRLLGQIDRCFGIANLAEITAETNPKSADRKKLCDIRKAGVNRLSIGMQSVHDSELKALGRIHNFEDFKVTFSDAREVGFDNISADLMYGIPKQTAESFCDSVETLMSFSPEHISSYCLAVEEGTNFYRRRESLELPEEDQVSDMYGEMRKILVSGGYSKYEISNFAKAGKKSRHNLKYWKCSDYLGFGAAAHSYFGGVRFAHSRDIDAYIEGDSIIIDREEIGLNDAMNEFIMLGMRLASGVSFAEFKKNFGKELLEMFPNFKKYAPEYVVIDEKGCRFTEKGMFVSNYILADVI